eukprot:803494_1
MVRTPLETTLQKEIHFCELRFREHEIHSSQEDGPTSIDFQFRPTDPDFPHIFDSGLMLTVTFPENFPSEGPSVTVRNPNNETSSEVKRTICTGCDKFIQRHKGDNLMRDMLRWLDRNLAQLIDIGQEMKVQNLLRAQQNSELANAYTRVRGEVSLSTVNDGARKTEINSSATEAWTSEQDQALEVALARFPTSLPTSERWKKIGSEVPGKTTKECLRRTREIQAALKQQRKDTIAESEIASTTNPPEKTGNDSTINVRKGTEINFVELELNGIGVVTVAKLALQLRCTKCKAPYDTVLLPSTLYRTVCERCGSVFAANMRTVMAHNQSPTIGYVDLDSCSVADILPSDFTASCEECSSNHTFSRLLRGTSVDESCRTCFARLEIRFEDFALLRLTSSRSLVTEAQKAKMKKKPKVRDPFKPGEPLPLGGACPHYKNSQRWFRFPCCGKVFPCDTCHDKDVTNRHVMEWATRMVCGRCGKEQKVGDMCSKCQLEFVRSATAFWEGGKGMRNKQKMSKHEPKKYAGLHKTVSKKSQKNQK